ncbi:Centractin [Schizosaccharomyces pombe]
MTVTEIFDNQPICIDNGSGFIKAGFAGDDIPKCLFPTCVGRIKHERVMPSSIQKDMFVGSEAQNLRGLLKIQRPIERGIIQNWSDMEEIWSYIYSDQQLNTLPEEHPLLLTEPPLANIRNKEKIAEYFYETLNVPALSFSLQPVLALYASARTTGIVLECGDGLTHSVPIYDGFSIPSAIQQEEIGGRDATDYLQLQLRKSGHELVSSAEKEIVREIKEKCCYVASDFRSEIESWTEHKPQIHTYQLPDNQTITLGTECFSAPEVLFNPEMMGSEASGLHIQLFKSILLSDIDLRSTLYSNIVLSGGSTLLRGFGERFISELRAISGKKNQVKIYASPERMHNAWLGGSILASLSTFRRLLITSEEYKNDQNVIFRRRF